MNKFLRYSLSLVLAFVASVTLAQEVTFDFDKDYKTLFPELTGTSSSTSKDGDITKAMTCTINGISVAVSAKTSGSIDNRIWSSSPRTVERLRFKHLLTRRLLLSTLMENGMIRTMLT